MHRRTGIPVRRFYFVKGEMPPKKQTVKRGRKMQAQAFATL